MKKRINCFLLLFITPFLVFSQSRKKEFDILKQSIEELSFINRQQALESIQKMFILASNSPDSSLLIAQTLYYKALINHRQSILDTTIIDRVSKRLEQSPKPSYENNFLMCALELSLLTQEDFSGSFEIAIQAIENAEPLNDSLCMAQSFNTLGIICDKVNLFDLSEEYYLKGLKWAKKGSAIYYGIKNNIFNRYLFRNKDDDFTFTDSVKVLMDKATDKGVLLHLYINTGNYWAYKKEHDRSFPYLHMAEELCEDNPLVQSIIYNNLGCYYLEKKEYDNALNYFNMALRFFEKQTSPSTFSFIYGNISNLYEQTNKIDSALLYLKKSIEYDNTNDRKTLIIEAHRQRLTSSLERTQDKLELAESEIKLKNKQVIIILLSSLTIITVGILLFIILSQKRKSMKQRILLKEAETKELSARLEKEQIIQKNQAMQLESKLREITSYSLLLSNKNQVLRQIQDVSERIPATEKSIKREIKSIIKENLQTESDWNDFMLHFNNVHPQFFERLQKLCPQITQLEQKLAAYIRLGLPTTQIAQMLNVTPESIRSNRYRLRKKLDLEKEENIDTFIQNL